MTAADHPLAGRPTTRCRWCSDRALLVWCLTGAEKRIPIEAEPNPAGNVEIRIGSPAAAPLAVVHQGPPGMLDDWVAYMPHHATCPRDLTEPTTP